MIFKKIIYPSECISSAATRSIDSSEFCGLLIYVYMHMYDYIYTNCIPDPYPDPDSDFTNTDPSLVFGSVESEVNNIQ
jgi:hypothetical protein